MSRRRYTLLFQRMGKDESVQTQSNQLIITKKTTMVRLLIQSLVVLFILLVSGCIVDPPNEQLVHTEGLIFELSEDYESYQVVGYEGTSTDIVIASTYNGLPVTSVGFRSKNWPNQTCDITEKLVITSLTLSDAIDSFDFGAFSCHEFSHLESIQIPSNITYFAHAFYYINRHIDIVISSDHPNLKEMVVNGVELVVTKDEKELVYIPFTDDETTEFIIPEGIEQIADYAGAYTNFLSITVPNSLYKVGDYAFFNTFGRREDSISTQILNFGNQITYIGMYAFSGGYEVEELVIPENIEYIGKFAFSFNNIQSLIIQKHIGISSIIFNDLDVSERANQISSIEFVTFMLEDEEYDLFTYHFIYSNFVDKEGTIQIVPPETNNQKKACEKSIEISLQIANMRKSANATLPTFLVGGVE